MRFTKSFLASLAACNVTGDFSPFTTGSISAIEDYVSQLLVKLKESPDLLVGEQDIFSSFIEVKVSKADKSDTQITRNELIITESTTSLALYFCTLAPYWFYGACNWSTNWIGFIGGSCTGGSSCFLAPESLARVDHGVWDAEVEIIKRVTQEFRYVLLPVEELTQLIPIDLPFETLLSEKPYRVFDCFFYWVD